VQRISEEQASNIILPWLEKEQTRRVLCAGGFFLNVKFNQKLWYSNQVDVQWVYPNAGDSGLAVGSALYAYYDTHPEAEPAKLEHLYHGSEYSNEEIQKILDERGLVYTCVEDPSDVAARYLVENYVLGWFQGRMEAGPRALGNRSILMSPLRAENKDLINRKIKYREPFRPFAPALPVEKMHEYLVNAREECFMTCSFDVVPEKRSSIPAVVHVDGTARPQMVKREQNPRYYDLIMKFGELTGEYVVLNTSFNVKGEPIVCHPREALKCFFDTGMDVLIMNNYVIEKPALKRET
jgi:carbamoyltransferase